ncbi:MAG: O-acetylhomoserine aminocarboxypropyltransferase/cysteine synthase, partial [Thermoguttaceae bacterium]|nr:O-acetylhomoserine aminocarboxypropyltransferase/cysteine synthase [Thermoguttaceae bacterium]
MSAAPQNPVDRQNCQRRLETLALHAGQTPAPTTGAFAVPVFRTTAYDLGSSRRAADLFALRESGDIYARLSNPTNDVLERRLAALDGGIAATTFASGTAAIYFTITNIATFGDNIVSANNLYGGTFTQFDAILRSQGIDVRFTPVNDFAAVEAAIDEKTRAIYVETIGNPGLEVADLERYAALASRCNVPFIVDATFTPPTLLRPIEHGADVVVHSLSKWIGGHGAGIGGIAIDAGKFDWSDPKFRLFNEPDRGYDGLRFATDLGDLNSAAFSVRLRTVGLRNQGATLAPDAAWTFLLGVETLPLRVERHCENALAVARFLDSRSDVSWVKYPGLNGGELAQKYLPNGAGGVVAFGLPGGAAAARRFVDSVEL